MINKKELGDPSWVGAAKHNRATLELPATCSLLQAKPKNQRSVIGQHMLKNPKGAKMPPKRTLRRRPEGGLRQSLTAIYTNMPIGAKVSGATKNKKYEAALATAPSTCIITLPKKKYLHSSKQFQRLFIFARDLPNDPHGVSVCESPTPRRKLSLGFYYNALWHSAYPLHRNDTPGRWAGNA